MKRIISLAIVGSLIFTGCATKTPDSSQATTLSEVAVTTSLESIEETIETYNELDLTSLDYLDDEVDELGLSSLSDPLLLSYVEGAVYSRLIDEVDEGSAIENVSAIYISQEYIDELTYNSQANIFFGYTLEELNEQFQGEKYVFTVENGQTVVQPMAEYDDTYYQIIRNVAIGTGVILLCVTISVVTGGTGGPAAVSMIFAMAAESGATVGLSTAAISGISASLSTGIETGDWNQAAMDGLLAGSEGFMFGAICGTILGGAGEAIGLHGAALSSGMTMDQVATIQNETRLPLSIIRQINWEQYEIIRESGMFGQVVNGQMAVIRPIDLDYVDPESGLTNLQRMQQGLAALDPATGEAFELHHIGQTQNANLAILTQAEHRGTGVHQIWHNLSAPSEVNHGAAWNAQRAEFWRSLARILA